MLNLSPRTFGFKRLGPDIKTTITAIYEESIEEKKISYSNDCLTLFV